MKTRFYLCLFLLLAITFTTGYGQTTLSAGFKMPKYEKYLLPSGLTVYLLEHHEVPIIYAKIVVLAGAEKDGENYGLAGLTADALMFGTKNYSKQQIAEKLEFLGCQYRASAGLESATVRANFLKEDIYTVMPILVELISCPTFNQAEFDKRKEQLLLELELIKESPQDVIFDYYSRFLFGSNSYGNSWDGTVSAISRLTLDDVKNFYNNYYKPANAAIIICGDFKSALLKSKIENWFKAWNNKGKPQQPADLPLPSFDKNRVLLVDKEDATETQYMAGGFGISRNNPDRVAIDVVNTIFGGRFTSWLMDELRTNNGLTYGARSEFTSYKKAGFFSIASYTATETTEKILDLTVQLVDRLHQQGIDEATLQSAKNYMKGQFPPDYETAGNLADLLSEMFIYDLNDSYINDFQKSVDSLTVEKTKEIINKYFPKKENLQFVLIGKASEILEIAKKYGELTEKSIKADGY